jgi:glycosyltransferase involved in cell wall biosynthesis
VIPTYQRAHLITRAVDSALACIRRGDEIIVVDDGSTDETSHVLAPYQGRVRYIRKPNGGAGSARNHGMHASRGDLVAFLDSDDEWMPDKLRLQRATMRAFPRLVGCCSEFGRKLRHTIEPCGGLRNWITHPRSGFVSRPPAWSHMLGSPRRFSSIAPLPPGRPNFDVYIGDLYPWMMEALCICTTTTMVRGHIARQCLHFPEGCPTYEDWYCFGRLSALGPMAYLDCATSWNIQHSGDRLTDTDSLRSTRTRIDMLMAIWGKDLEFLARHGERFQRVLGRQHMILFWRLLRHGRLREAFQELPRLRGSTSRDAIEAILPGNIVRRIHSLADPARPAAATAPENTSLTKIA